MGNAKSLRGGTLLMTPLKGVDSQVYALAQGNILVGGAGASAGGSSVQVNQLNGGRITNGAVIERELPSQFGVGNTLNLQLNDEDFSMAQQIADTINRVRGYGSATALDARTIQVRVPSGNSSQVRFLADIQNMQVNVTPQDAKVVINSRTGSVVMNREVTRQLRSSAGESLGYGQSSGQCQPARYTVWWWTDCGYSTNADRFTPERRFAAKRTFQRQPQ